ncbi:hypothetical protein MIMGU_mgv11b021105mg [Erythranthe guttata]|uniref:Germin-like protein n=1 Tax=Erythranthe guttata TaxID=4155 RepID=A0A022RHT6_ERYGU|nr:hypothetical protein MIMGU_mgv11b021105mg [Erythranthe guttata]
MFRSRVTPVNVNQLPGLNTLGISAARIDYAPLNPPYTYSPNPVLKNKLFAKYLYPGDMFVFREGLIHFQFNVGKNNAVAFADLSSQNSGVITVANVVFGSNPQINPAVLIKGFQVEKNVIDHLEAQFWTNTD